MVSWDCFPYQILINSVEEQSFKGSHIFIICCVYVDSIFCNIHKQIYLETKTIRILKEEAFSRFHTFVKQLLPNRFDFQDMIIYRVDHFLKSEFLFQHEIFSYYNQMLNVQQFSLISHFVIHAKMLVIVIHIDEFPFQVITF